MYHRIYYLLINNNTLLHIYLHSIYLYAVAYFWGEGVLGVNPQSQKKVINN